jgi:hypothetical protein
MADQRGFVRFQRASYIGVVFVVILLAAASAGAWPHRQWQKVQVRFLASSTFYRTTWGFNEDTYLAQLQLPKDNEQVLVRLVDAYPNAFAPLSRATLRSESGTMLAVRRDQECDRPFGEILLRTAPGDPMAILPERLGYQPQLDRTPAPGTILPCYRVLRR